MARHRPGARFARREGCPIIRSQTNLTPTDMDIGSNPLSVAVGDFNADGKMDLGVTSNIYHPGTEGTPGTPGYCVHHYGDYSYSPTPGTGGDWTPTFGYEVCYPGTPYTNGTPSYYEGRANVLLGNGDGSFSAPNTTGLGNGSHIGAAVADFNGDGNQDFATANYDYGTVSVLLGTGTGALGVPTDFNAGSNPKSVAAGDVNGDGKLDQMTANQGGGTVSVLLGNGLGSFGLAQGYAMGANPSEVAVADFNRDGKLDLVTANENGTVSVLLGNGDGAFQPARNYAAGSRSVSVTAGDFNDDLLPDVAVANINSNNVSVLLNDGIWLPSISIGDVAVIEGNTGTVSATFTVSLSAAYGQPVTVHYQTANGSATTGSDYIAASGNVTFAAGETSQTVTVPVNGDVLNEADETFLVNLSGATDATIADGQGVGSILNDDAVPSLAISDVTVTEGNAGTVSAAFTVSLSAASGQTVTVSYATADGTARAGSDYVAAAGNLTVAPWETSKTVTVLVNGDVLNDVNETFTVDLSNPTNATIADGQGVGAILNDDPVPTLTINDVTRMEGNSGITYFVFTVSLSAASGQTVIVNYATADSSAKVSENDYVATSGTLTFAPGETTKTITVVVKGDRKKEANENFFLNLTDGLNAVILDGQGIGTIQNDD